VAFHNNVINFYGISIADQGNDGAITVFSHFIRLLTFHVFFLLESQNVNVKKYLLVMEYADGGSI
jgi:hypothetical protein